MKRILQNYHWKAPGPFDVFNQGVTKGVLEHREHPVLAAHSEMLTAYLTTSETHHGVFQEAKLGGARYIMQRDVLQKQIVIYLDQIASLFEMAAITNPEILASCGFDLAKERRGSSRSKPAPAASEAPTVEAKGDNG